MPAWRARQQRVSPTMREKKPNRGANLEGTSGLASSWELAGNDGTGELGCQACQLPAWVIAIHRGNTQTMTKQAGRGARHVKHQLGSLWKGGSLVSYRIVKKLTRTRGQEEKSARGCVPTVYQILSASALPGQLQGKLSFSGHQSRVG